MIFHDAFISLKNDLSRAFFYWLTFVITSMFIFLFFNISMSETVGVHFINAASNTATNLTIFLIVICLVIIFFANDFFVRNKAKELAVHLVTGATYIQMASYLLIQTFLLLILSLPVGILLGISAIPIVNVILSTVLESDVAVAVTFSAAGATSLILGSVVFWTTYLNMAFAYRHTAATLLNRSAITAPEGIEIIRFPAWFKWQKQLSIVMLVLPLILIFLKKDVAVIAAMVGLIGLNGCMKYVFEPWLNGRIAEGKIEDPLHLAWAGFLRRDIAIMKPNIYLILATGILLIAVLVGNDNSAMEIMLVLLSYAVMNVLLSFAIMFRLSTELTGRTSYFATLLEIGYLKEDQDAIVRNEITVFYGLIILIAVVYIGVLLTAEVLAGNMMTSTALILTAGFVLPLVLAGIVNWVYYHRTVERAREIVR